VQGGGKRSAAAAMAIEAALGARALESAMTSYTQTHQAQTNPNPLHRLVFDDKSSYYFDPVSGYYFDTVRNLFYDGVRQRYMKWDEGKSEWVHVGDQGDAAPAAGATATHEQKPAADKDKDKEVRMALYVCVCVCVCVCVLIAHEEGARRSTKGRTRRRLPRISSGGRRTRAKCPRRP
jgi:hypothetical protein